MSLVRLLTTGNSLLAAKANTGRYRLTRQRLLPHFGSARNPFRSKENSAPVRTEARGPEGPGPDGALASKRGIPGSSEKPAAIPCRVKDRVEFRSASSQGWMKTLRLTAVGLLSGWAGRMSGLLARPRAKAVRPAIPRLTKHLVQSQLSLDRIRVVRNDLRDADLEVVTARPPPAPTIPMHELQGKHGGSVQESIPGRVAARVVGANKPPSDEGR